MPWAMTSSWVRRNVRAALYAGITTTIFLLFSIGSSTTRQTRAQHPHFHSGWQLRRQGKLSSEELDRLKQSSWIAPLGNLVALAMLGALSTFATRRLFSTTGNASNTRRPATRNDQSASRAR